MKSYSILPQTPLRDASIAAEIAAFSCNVWPPQVCGEEISLWFLWVHSHYLRHCNRLLFMEQQPEKTFWMTEFVLVILRQARIWPRLIQCSRNKYPPTLKLHITPIINVTNQHHHIVCMLHKDSASKAKKRAAGRQRILPLPPSPLSFQFIHNSLLSHHFSLTASSISVAALSNSMWAEGCQGLWRTINTKCGYKSSRAGRSTSTQNQRKDEACVRQKRLNS